MPRTLFVHVGPRKTATSAIQDFLRNHDNSTIIYPKVGLYDPGPHHGLVFKFFGEENKRLPRKSIDELFETIAAEAMDSEKNVVISSEALEIETRDVGDFVRALLPYVSRTPIDVDLVFACREHFARAASWYNHRMRAVNGGEQHHLPDEFLDQHAREVCYAPLARRLKSTGFKVTALNYHPSQDWTERFLRYIGFPETNLPRVDMRHVALSPKVLIAKVATNKAVKSKVDRRKYLNAFTAMPGSHSPSKFIFGREAAERADRMFGEDRLFLKNEFGIEIVPPDLTAQDNLFYISPNEFEEIVAVARGLGEEGSKITKFARQYVRDYTG